MRGGLANVPECAVAISFSVFMQQNFYCRLFFLRLVGNGWGCGVVWQFDARTWQTVAPFIRCNALEISTIRQMHYTRCWR